MIDNADISNAMKIHLEKIFHDLPEMPSFVPGVRRASKRSFTLTQTETALALKNALRYIPEKWHEKLAPEFLDELLTMGRIYGYRFRPEEKIPADPSMNTQGIVSKAKHFR